MKKELEDDLNQDLDIARGAMREIIANNRKLNKTLMQSMEEADFGLLEEYSILQKGILDASKLLSDIHSAKPKTIKEIQSIEGEKQKIDLNDLVD